MQKKPKRVSLFNVMVLTLAAVAVCFVWLNQIDSNRLSLESTLKEAELRRIEEQARRTTMQNELAVSETDAYVMEKARSLYGYLLPGEIRYVITNTDALYDDFVAVVDGVGL